MVNLEATRAVRGTQRIDALRTLTVNPVLEDEKLKRRKVKISSKDHMMNPNAINFVWAINHFWKLFNSIFTLEVGVLSEVEWSNS